MMPKEEPVPMPDTGANAMQPAAPFGDDRIRHDGNGTGRTVAADPALFFSPIMRAPRAP